MQNRENSIRVLIMLNALLRRLQRFLLLSLLRGLDMDDVKVGDEIGAGKKVPDDVKKGHFAVTAVKGQEPRRFVVELSCLNSLEFLKLLEQAKEEYGFHQKGVLSVPCQPEELQMILDNRRRKRKTTGW